MRIAYNRQTPANFWSRVDQSGGPDACWNWQGACNNTGYGTVGWHGTTYTAHRVAAWLWKMVLTPAAPKHKSDPTHVLHSCDNRRCCNPTHFFLGSYSDNQRDAYAKRRRTPFYGSAHTNARFSADDIAKIRRHYLELGSYAAVASLHKVADTTIANIIKGRTYGME